MERKVTKGRLCTGPSSAFNQTRGGQNQEIAKRGSEEERPTSLYDPCERDNSITESYQQNLCQQSSAELSAASNEPTIG